MSHSSIAATPKATGRQPASRTRLARTSARRGFTLIELLVALLAGLFVAMAAFMLARNASQFFQHEARLSAAQYAVMVGMNRLAADLQRASFLALPNPANPHYKFAASKTPWPASVALPMGITIEKGGSVTRHDADHSLTKLNHKDKDGADLPDDYPDALILSGSFNTTESFGVSAIVDSGGTSEIYLQVHDGAMARTLEAASHGGPTLEEIFAPGRYVSICDKSTGFTSYGVISKVAGKNLQWLDAITPYVTLEGSPALPSRATEGHSGVAGFGSTSTVSVVSRVLYDLRSAAGYPEYAALYARARHSASGQHAGVAEAQRTELVRVEIDTAGKDIAGTAEVVAEYAVDLKFGITHEAAVPTSPPTLVRLPIGDADVYNIAKAGGTPELVRSVQARLAIRAAEPDRDVNLTAPSTGGFYRFDLGPNLGFARVRTLITEVALPNNHAP